MWIIDRVVFTCGPYLLFMTKKKLLGSEDGKRLLWSALSLFTADRILSCDVEKIILSHQKILHCVNTSILRRKLGTAVRKKTKQWLLYLNDAVSIFQWWQGGQTSGIIVTRATGCPEEEVRAELYASIQGQRGWRLGGFHFFPSSLSASSRVSLQRGVASSTQDAVTLLHQAAGFAVYSQAAVADANQICSHEGNLGAESNSGLQKTGAV